MASITIRRLDDAVKSKLRIVAAGHGRSMEEEALQICLGVPLALAGRQIMEPDQIDIFTRTVLRNLQEINNAKETGLSRQLRGDTQETDRLNGIHFDFTIFHPVSFTHFHMGAFPDSNAARDFPASNSLPKTLSKNHEYEFTRAFGRLTQDSEAAAPPTSYCSGISK